MNVMDETLTIDTAIGAMLANMSPSSRSHVMHVLARELRKRQQKRIARQMNPDGTPFAPRKRPINRDGSPRGKMFRRERLARNLPVKASDSEASVAFRGPNTHTEQVHQFGLVDHVGRYHTAVRYPARRLLGFTDEDIHWIEELILNHIAGES
ncbi:phage virion morphogenesis protein [Salmonella enterica]|nr:phage virion morphogenesis protein [Salmonella enterica subsp. diarizonae]ELB6470215.1 phage virion morphogenesis protein [Salmonella enterica]